ncbi:unnamed protein product [Brassicogethes aeneus]|uniref:Uncharacterized protein n=1 Tax=Brassicogethes aeneus TaxID=1431903 RepID=A0A9P0FD93_BRAAE|nr:unnamed protein product [Brassicogethes aeneus]
MEDPKKKRAALLHPGGLALEEIYFVVLVKDQEGVDVHPNKSRESTPNGSVFSANGGGPGDTPCLRQSNVLREEYPRLQQSLPRFQPPFDRKTDAAKLLANVAISFMINIIAERELLTSVNNIQDVSVIRDIQSSLENTANAADSSADMSTGSSTVAPGSSSVADRVASWMPATSPPVALKPSGIQDVSTLGGSQGATSDAPRRSDVGVTQHPYVLAGGLPEINCHDAPGHAGPWIAQQPSMMASGSFPAVIGAAPGCFDPWRGNPQPTMSSGPFFTMANAAPGCSDSWRANPHPMMVHGPHHTIIGAAPGCSDPWRVNPHPLMAPGPFPTMFNAAPGCSGSWEGNQRSNVAPDVHTTAAPAAPSYLASALSKT